MKNSVFAATLAMIVAFAGTAFASDVCDVPKDEWQPMEALQAKLEADGWTIKKMKVDDGCYKTHATDAEGQQVKAYFNPKTFEAVKTKTKAEKQRKNTRP
uniref:Peptidase propeptide and YPEB domain-containing protein n=1 Tax=Candidatus Kentrum sp. FM TaxID=2126340 RepID=A0A450T1I1_9GAMM|nr:MAG: Peptidase propeptide and YPEB domain-containing protein [Candidatus Kentron sp. FM]VFJ73460.1 MAG: Peptidase propeptide and YPEB domain-containing protein [Candidatus Kentron sp. FM]VFK21066.1 MAG: Peptidase propeptide and YPEB domain-containing protein [Candidatus Kentron sp. FM]